MDITLNSRNRRALTIAVVVALVVGALLLVPFFSVIALSLIAAYTFYPIFAWLNKHLKREGLAAALTSIATLLAVIVPIVFVSYVTFQELQQAAQNLSTYTRTNDVSKLSEQIVTKANNYLADVTGSDTTFDITQVKEFAVNNASKAIDYLMRVATSSVGSIGAFVTAFVLYIYIFTSALINRKALIRIVTGLNPLGEKISALYLRQAGMMTGAMVRGQFIIAVLQGFTSAAVLYIAGVEVFWIMALLLTLLSIIPLGGGVVTIPIGIALLIMGNIWQGILVLAVHFLIITNIDNVLRPLLVPKEARLDSALTILSVFAGISFFGILGIVIGPVLMILIVTTIRIYLHQLSKEPEPKKI